jgi:DNA-binding IclR family transcriptional regulator
LKNIPLAITQINHDSEKFAGYGENGGVAALDRAFSILRAFYEPDEDVTLSVLANRTGLYKSTILRLLTSLENSGLVVRAIDGKYSIGPESLRLARLYQNSFRERDTILGTLRRLSEATGETLSFYVRWKNIRVVLYKVESTREVRVAMREGDQRAIDMSAAGQVLRAFALYPEYAHLENKSHYFCVSSEESDCEVVSVAAPVFCFERKFLGAISLSAPRERIGTPVPMLEIRALLIAAAAKASEALGADPSIFPDLNFHALPP